MGNDSDRTTSVLSLEQSSLAIRWRLIHTMVTTEFRRLFVGTMAAVPAGIARQLGGTEFGGCYLQCSIN